MSVMLGILIGCAVPSTKDVIRKKPPYVVHETDPVFYEYLDKLPLKNNTPIIFSDRKEGVAGTCTMWSDGYREIQIDPKYWNKIDRSHRLQLIAHEIGHCDYDLDHDDSMSEDNCPMSAMNGTNFGGECFEKYFDYYMEEIYE